jgi:ABC-type amino acid transport substrate-binding protein
MRKFISILVLATIVIFSLSACGQKAAQTTATAPAPVPSVIQLNEDGLQRFFNGKNLAVIYQNLEEKVLSQKLDNFVKNKYNFDFHCNIIYVDSLTDGLLMLRGNKIDTLQVMRFTGDYLLQRNTDLKMYSNDIISYSTQMIFNPEKPTQLDKVNAALKAMQQDGTLDKLVKQWITDLPVGGEPASGAIPVIDGAETLKVGISGDAPPLDYVAANGNPGGFNVAVLSEISKRAKLNIKLVRVSGGARFTALQSGKIDSFLWHNTSQSFTGSAANSTPSDQTKSFLMSDTYLNSRGGLLVLNK